MRFQGETWNSSGVESTGPKMTAIGPPILFVVTRLAYVSNIQNIVIAWKAVDYR